MVTKSYFSPSNKEVSFNMSPNPDEVLLSHEDRVRLDSLLTVDELKTSLEDMKNNKCPGIDGLTKEFYICFFEQLSDQLLQLYLHSYEKGILNPSARMGLISLIPKKQDNLLELNSYRPLTLLNLDFKILSKTMARRIQPCLKYLIAEHQTGFMPGRNITENIRRTYEIIRYCKRTNKPGLIVSIDFSKCFDKIEHSAIQKSLEYFGFGENIITWIMLFFKEMNIYTQNFGFLSPVPFSKGRGTNQGCCISPSLFLLCGEIMSRRLLENKKIKGIDMNNGQIRNLLSQFADDTALYIAYDRISLEETIKTLSHIETNIGLSINYDKTLIYRIGSASNSDAQLVTQKTLCWTSKPFKLLGVYIGNDEHEVDNYTDIIKKMKSVLEMWYHRQFTLMGKVLIVNTLCESLFVYRLSVTTDVSSKLIKTVESMVGNFLWGNKSAKIAKDTLQKDKMNGGLRLFDLRSKQAALKINWVKKIETDDMFRYCFFENTRLPKVDFIFHCNLNAKDCKKYVDENCFWGQLMLHWCEYHYSTPTNLDTVLTQTIWFNSIIKRGGKVLFNQECVGKGMITVRDIFDANSPDGFKEYDTVTREYGVRISWLEYMGIISSIPKEWKTWFTKGELTNELDPCVCEQVKNNAKISNLIYKNLIAEDITPKYAMRWAEKEGIFFEFDEYKDAFKALYRCTKIVKYRDFQYRLLLNKLPCNQQLKDWKIIDNDRCNFCNLEKENISHTLFSCIFSKRIWKFVKELLSNYMTEINLENVLLNSIVDNPEHVANFICVVTKQYIYRCRCQKKKPNIHGISREILLQANIERSIAFINKKSKKQEKRWSLVKTDLLFLL